MRYGLFVCAVAFILLSLGVYPAGSETKRPLVISSTAFDDKGFIPRKYTCDGQDINPPLEFDNVPRKTKSLALIVDDPDAPGKTWVHWVLWNIDPSTRQIPENSVPKGAKQGTNDFKKRRYGGPCPPATHTYFFWLYAVDTELKLPAGATKDELIDAIRGHVLAQARMAGVYGR